jgi:hypothetical protein
MRLVLGHIRQKIQVQNNPKSYAFDLHWEEVNRLDVMTRELEGDLSSFRKLPFEEASVRNPSSTRVRSKRELIDILGYGMKYLFGTADARGVNLLAAVCDELHAFESKTVHSADHQLTYLRTLDEGTKQTVKDTTDSARTLWDSIRNFSLQLNRVEADLLDTQATIEKQISYSTAI